jgi:hypothetical protein
MTGEPSVYIKRVHTHLGSQLANIKMLLLVDKYYTEAIRMRQAAQTNRETYGTNYQPRNSGVDGQALWTKSKRREDVSDAFREIRLPYNPNLSQRLPARKEYELQTSAIHVNLKKEIARLQEMQDPKSMEQLKKQQNTKRALWKSELQNWQNNQTHHSNNQQEYHRRIFDRVQFMMPEKDRLARNLFEGGP